MPSYPSASLLELHQKTVAVITHAGVPVSIGRIRVHPGASGGIPRIEVVFHTENVSCAITVAQAALVPVAGGEGINFRYVLPPADELWSADFGPRRDDSEKRHEPVTSSKEVEAHVETFPLPPSTRLTGYSPTTTPKGDSPRERK